MVPPGPERSSPCNEFEAAASTTNKSSEDGTNELQAAARRPNESSEDTKQTEESILETKAKYSSRSQKLAQRKASRDTEIDMNSGLNTPVPSVQQAEDKPDILSRSKKLAQERKARQEAPASVQVEDKPDILSRSKMLAQGRKARQEAAATKQALPQPRRTEPDGPLPSVTWEPNEDDDLGDGHQASVPAQPIGSEVSNSLVEEQKSPEDSYPIQAVAVDLQVERDRLHVEFLSAAVHTEEVIVAPNKHAPGDETNRSRRKWCLILGSIVLLAAAAAATVALLLPAGNSSHVPSPAPSTAPSMVPSTAPSTAPSKAPSISVAPSSSPSS